MNWPKGEYSRFVSAPTDVIILGDGLAKKKSEASTIAVHTLTFGPRIVE